MGKRGNGSWNLPVTPKSVVLSSKPKECGAELWLESAGEPKECGAELWLESAGKPKECGAELWLGCQQRLMST